MDGPLNSWLSARALRCCLIRLPGTQYGALATSTHYFAMEFGVAMCGQVIRANGTGPGRVPRAWRSATPLRHTVRRAPRDCSWSG